MAGCFCFLHFDHSVPAGAPRSLYLWLGVACLMAGLVIAGWHHAHWPRRISGVAAVVLAVVSAGSAVNQTFQYYPSLDRLLGKNANHFVNNAQLTALHDQVAQHRHPARPRRHLERGHPRHRRHPPALYAPSRFHLGAASLVRPRPPPTARHRTAPRHPRRPLGLDPGHLRRRHLPGLRPTTPRPSPHPGHARRQRLLRRRHRMRQLGQFRRRGNLPEQRRARLHDQKLQRPHQRPAPWPSPACPKAAPAPSCSPSTTPSNTRPSPPTPGSPSPPTRPTPPAQTITDLFAGSPSAYNAHDPQYLLPTTATPAWPAGSKPAPKTPTASPPPTPYKPWPPTPA